MGRPAATVLYVLAPIAVVVGVDVLYFRHHFRERLMVNVGMVLVPCAALECFEVEVVAIERPGWPVEL